MADRAEPKHIRIPVKTLVSVTVLLVILIVVAGFAHIVHGGGVGLKICAKDGWALGDTFVDLDDYIGKPLISQIEHAKVLRAMFACGALAKPQWLVDREREREYGSSGGVSDEPSDAPPPIATAPPDATPIDAAPRQPKSKAKAPRSPQTFDEWTTEAENERAARRAFARQLGSELGGGAEASTFDRGGTTLILTIIGEANCDELAVAVASKYRASLKSLGFTRVACPAPGAQVGIE